MKRHKLLLTVSALMLGAFSHTASALTIYVVTAGNKLARYDSEDANSITRFGYLVGFTNGDTSLVGIDYRIQDGLLYGVGNNGGIYTIDTSNSVMTFRQTLSVRLEGTSFGVDFNPAADRLRIVSNSGQNLRHDLNTAITLVDDPLDYPPASPLNTAGPTVQGICDVAYSNNDYDPATGTTLFTLDSTLDQLDIQSPPNNGTLSPVTKLSIPIGLYSGLDILTTLKDGKAVTNIGYIAVDNGNVTSTLYSVDLFTGTVSAPLATTPRRIIDFAVPPNQ
ncbi:DUF4394 domain-containing protein [Nevskia sp.]|uniref:DUF4394 domain-containing protein n=1 Tax=Nevskia sp. TaxID=1929292 RepID=UPI0025D63296|nr:DUF4394 domain-containing protein [Nevskia sp.]